MIALKHLWSIALCTASAAGQLCQTNTLTTTTPSSITTGVALQSFYYCGGKLNVVALIANTGYRKLVNIYYADAQNQSTSSTVLPLSYGGAIGTGVLWEYWYTPTAVTISSISTLLNITYISVDTNKTYAQILNVRVQNSGQGLAYTSPILLPGSAVSAASTISTSTSLPGLVGATASTKSTSLSALTASTALSGLTASTAPTLSNVLTVPTFLTAPTAPTATTVPTATSISNVLTVPTFLTAPTALSAPTLSNVLTVPTLLTAPTAPSALIASDGSSALPTPKVEPKGFAQDISNFVSTAQGSLIGQSFARLFQNINPDIDGAAPGSVVAAMSGPGYAQQLPDYEYSWVRDSALVMDVVQTLYGASTSSDAQAAYERLLFDYADTRATEQTYPGLLTSLGEPKFYLNQTLFTGQWARPQNDGPALSAITLLQFATQFLANGGNESAVRQYIYDSTTFPSTAPVQKDLLYIAANWSSPSFDLWEEVSGNQFFTRMVQRRAIVLGIPFAARMGDAATAYTLANALNALTSSLSQFWSASRSAISYEAGPVLGGKTSFLDSSVILAILHGYADDDVLSPLNDQVLASVLRIATAFISVYPINSVTTDAAGRPLGIAIGRYPEDAYNGTGTQSGGGNPWYLATAGLAEYMYRLSKAYDSAGEIVVTNTSKPFFDYFAPSAKLAVGQTYVQDTQRFRQVISSLNGWGDAFLRTIKQYMPPNGSLSEQFNKVTGAPQGAADLSWSYAALLTAAFARADVQGKTTYVTNMADEGLGLGNDS